jgi:hypothetical protein
MITLWWYDEHPGRLRHGCRNGFEGALDKNPEGESGPRA